MMDHARIKMQNPQMCLSFKCFVGTYVGLEEKFQVVISFPEAPKFHF